jgi:two-component system, NarL family, nitrate/nitrite response regulator NarL
VKVIVITDIRLYRDGVAEALSRLDDVELAVTAANGAAAVLTVRRAECDVALLDMALADNTEAIALLRRARPNLKVVALGVAEDGPAVVACAEAGVCGYVSRDASLAELADALRSAVRGEAPLSGRVAAGLLRHIALHADARQTNGADHRLTPRERDVLRLLQSGMTNRQIARALGLQLSTVKNHVHNILAKLGVHGRADIARAQSRTLTDPVPVPTGI